MTDELSCPNCGTDLILNLHGDEWKCSNCKKWWELTEVKPE